MPFWGSLHTDDHKYKDEGGHTRTDVEHESDVICQLVYILYIRNKHGWDQKPNGNTQLQKKKKRKIPFTSRCQISLQNQ